MNPFDYVVRFRIGKSSERFNLLEVEIDEQDLELVARLTEGAAPKKTKRRVVKVP
jgi:hypothetical protein